VDLTPEQEWEYFAGLDERGVTQVRFELEHGQIPPRFVHLASKWLSDKEREAKDRAEEQMEVMNVIPAAAERQATAAEKANTRANIALLIAAVSLIVSIIGLFKH
jgi:hypothetical protein